MSSVPLITKICIRINFTVKILIGEKRSTLKKGGQGGFKTLIKPNKYAVSKLFQPEQATVMPEIEILKDLFFIQRGFLNGNHFVYRSDNPVLIDTAYIADFDHTEKSISRLGVNLAELSLIISTHTHCDHIGGNYVIQQRSGCDIALHKIGKYFIDIFKKRDRQIRQW